jgi:hypothetical protein
MTTSSPQYLPPTITSTRAVFGKTVWRSSPLKIADFLSFPYDHIMATMPATDDYFNTSRFGENRMTFITT